MGKQLRVFWGLLTLSIFTIFSTPNLFCCHVPELFDYSVYKLLYHTDH